MKTLTFLFLCIAVHIGNAQVTLTDSNLPIVVINTLGGTIIDSAKITCEMGIIWNGDGLRNNITDPYNDYFGKIGIEIRGSTSQMYPKKSYGLETRDDVGNKQNVSILGMPSENDWVLYGAYPDKTLMRNELTYSLFAQMQPWSPRYVYCELVINGQYRGLYTFMERIKRDKDRVDIAKLDADDIAGDSLTGGYIIKVDKTTGSSSSTWTSAYQDKVKFLYHDPEDTELSIEQKNYIRNYVSDFEDAVYGSDFTDPELGYAKYIDMRSFHDFMIMQELGRTVDGYRSSSFMYKDKDSKGGKLTCGPMWDFNLSYGNAAYCDAYLTEGWQYNFASVCPEFSTEPPLWWQRLQEDPNFNDQLQCRWQMLRKRVLHLDSIYQWIDNTAAYIDEAKDRNFIKWPVIGVYVDWNYFVGATYEEEIEYLKWWFATRIAYMDATLPGTCSLATGIDQAEAENKIELFPNPSDKACTFRFENFAGPTEKRLVVYNMQGQLVESHSIAPNQAQFTLERNQKSAGIYLYQLIDKKGLIASGKFELR